MPNTSLEEAFQFSDQRLGAFVQFLESSGKMNSTLLLIGSKQGQGPVNPATLVVSEPQTVVDAAQVNVTFFVAEDGGIVGLNYSLTYYG